MPVREKLLGQKFHRLLVIQDLKTDWKTRGLWICYCDCGNTAITSTKKLKSGNTKSCGCLRKECTALTGKSNTIHGLTGTPQYNRYKVSKYRTDKLSRTPKWCDEDLILEIYRYCPENFEVDHIIPLRGGLVSGLHVPENLQYLYAPLNWHKGNKFVPITTNEDSESVQRRKRSVR